MSTTNSSRIKMKQSISWFSQGPMRELFQPGKTVQLSHPQQTRWKIEEIIKEYDHQMDKEHMRADAPSYAAIKLLCSDAGNPSSHAMMRAYVQIPHANTELEDAGTRGTQAMKFKPKELKALQKLSQNTGTSVFTPNLAGYHESKQGPSGLVPGGFITFIAWEIVPGICLGSPSGRASGFWGSVPDLEERNLIRAKFQDTLMLIRAAGIEPEPFCASNLVWDANTETLFWVGFREWLPGTPGPWSKIWWYVFDLVKVPPHEDPLDPEWNGDTRNWEW